MKNIGAKKDVTIRMDDRLYYMKSVAFNEYLFSMI
jgi:hypothetical protein